MDVHVLAGDPKNGDGTEHHKNHNHHYKYDIAVFEDNHSLDISTKKDDNRLQNQNQR